MDIQLGQTSKNSFQIQQWLCAFDFLYVQQDHLSIRHPGTCDWFVDSADFCSWRDSSETWVMWCHGIPGAGKTILWSVVIENLLSRYRDRCDVMVSSFFCGYDEERERTEGRYLASIAKQIFSNMDRWCHQKKSANYSTTKLLTVPHSHI